MFGKMMNSYYYGKSGKGDYRKEDLPKNRWQLFWEMLRTRLAALCRLNLIAIAAWLPLIILIGHCATTLLNVAVITSNYESFLETGVKENLTDAELVAVASTTVDVSPLVIEEYLDYQETGDRGALTDAQIAVIEGQGVAFTRELADAYELSRQSNALVGLTEQQAQAVADIHRALNQDVLTSYMHYRETNDAGALTDAQIEAVEQSAHDTSALYDNLFTSLINMFCLWCIPCILITGPIKAGLAYVTRNWARDEHAFVWSDFKDAVKANWKQGLGVGFITAVMPIIMWEAYRFYGQQASRSMVFIVPQMLVIMVGAVWALACLFLYPLMVTYEMKFSQLIKNGVLLAIARLPQTVGLRLLLLIPALLGVAAFWLFGGSLIPLLLLGGYYILIGFALSRFIGASFTNGVFDRFINAKMEGVKVNRGLAGPQEEDDEDDEESDAPADTPQ